MAALLNRKTGYLCTWLLACLMFSIILSAGGAFTVSGAEEELTFNSSGNLNQKPSVDPVGKSDGYSAVLYDNRNGLPTSEANAITQTGDGFIWIGSYAGLIRYDGNTFERIDSTTGIANVRCLYVDSMDRLWIGTNDSGVFLMTRGNLRNWNMDSGMESVSIRALIEDEDGWIYAGNTSGIAVIDSAMELTVLRDERIAGQTIREFRHGADGLIYGLTQNGDLFTLRDGQIRTFLGHDEFRLKGILAILPDPADPGKLYIGTEDSLVYHGSLEDSFEDFEVKSVAPLIFTESFEYIDGTLWICAGNGIGKLDTGSFTLESEGFWQLDGLPMKSSVGHMMTDYEGDLWFTSTRQGIMKIVPNQFSDLFDKYDLPAAVVNTTCLYGRQLFIGTDTGLIVVEDGKKLDRIPLTEAYTASKVRLEADDLLSYLDNVRIRSIIRDSKGRLWISTWRSHGLLRYDQGKLLVFNDEDGLYSELIRVVTECQDGSFAVAGNAGVNMIRGDQVTGGYAEKDGITNCELLTVTEGFNHELVLGSDGGGIFIIDSEGTRHIGLADGLNSEVILRIRRSRSRDIYWIVTSNSIAFMTPDFQVTTVRQFPYPNNYDLYENSKGEIWILSSNGIYVISEEKLMAGGEIEPAFYGINSGIPYVSTANSYSDQTTEGDLYIAGSAGVVLVNIEKPFEDFKDLKVSLPYVEADGKRYYPNGQGEFRLPGNIRKLTIYPYVFNYSLTDPQITFRLDGFDQTDTTVFRSKMTPVDYTNLRLGAFHFIMTVMDPVGHDEQTFSFRIVKGREMSVGDAGTIIMLLASLMLIGGIVIYMAPYRNRRQLEDRLRDYLIWVNVLMAAGELLSFVLEYASIPFVRELMLVGNTFYYISLVAFPYFLLLYLNYRVRKSKQPLRRIKLLYGIPLFLFCIVMMINLKTGWIFSISADNNYIPGFLSETYRLPQLPVLFYLALSLAILCRANVRLAVLGMVLVAARFAGELWYHGIYSTSFTYSLILVCINFYVIKQPANEVAL